ncbi:MAG: glucans biosynthesis glucosyltransferase MdoH, partial [Lysobacteraceae bacterium]
MSTASALPRPEVLASRHPNSLTAPPIHRGSMPTRPWRGFWNSLGTALMLRVNRLAGVAQPAPKAAPLEPWQ